MPNSPLARWSKSFVLAACCASVSCASLLVAAEPKSTTAAKRNDAKPVAAKTAVPGREAVAFFESKIRPVLVKQCYSCHSKDAKDLGGNLFLDSQEGLLKGGLSGPAVVAGNPDKSLLIQALKYDGVEMPPEHPVSESIVADFVKWVAMGAPDPRNAAALIAPKKAVADTTTDHWSFQPITRPQVPKVDDRGWSRSDIDRFIYARLATEKLQPVADADPRTLLRRLYVDLIGLPPTMERLEAFVAGYHKNPQRATEQIVDELLASPQFGERWGRHWLDVARYGESNGNDGLSRNPTFPHAWRYRDYVIAALNSDVPYDRFITEQIAGDLLPADTHEERVRLWMATGYLAIGWKPAKAMNINFDMDIVADQIDAVGTGIMGLSVACARCHDHKHDPIPTRDYYALAGIFASVESLYGMGAFDPLTAPATELYVLSKPEPAKPTESSEKKSESSDTKSTQNKPTETKPAAAADKAAAKPKAKPAVGKTTYKPGTPLAMGVRERSAPVDCKINIGGESNKLGASVPRGFLSAYPASLKRPEIDPKQSGRLQLAAWLTDPAHPQTSRVMANRIWHHLFGRGLVRTCDDFGVYGEKPSHPELLDYLASEFVADAWSVKKLIRKIVLSRTYQLSSTGDERAQRVDPENVLLWRHSRRRLDAESIRDAMLAASGKLDLRPAVGSAIADKDVLVNKSPNLHLPSDHRSVYLCLMRNSSPPELSAFDLPDALRPLGAREVTTLPTQALFLINSPFVVAQAGHLADALLADAATSAKGKSSADVESLVRQAYRRALVREPESNEVSLAVDFVKSVEVRLSESMPDQTERRRLAWSSFCQALLASTEFRHVD
jgi:hypothetical protein